MNHHPAPRAAAAAAAAGAGAGAAAAAAAEAGAGAGAGAAAANSANNNHRAAAATTTTTTTSTTTARRITLQDMNRAFQQDPLISKIVHRGDARTLMQVLVEARLVTRVEDLTTVFWDALALKHSVGYDSSRRIEKVMLGCTLHNQNIRIPMATWDMPHGLSRLKDLRVLYLGGCLSLSPDLTDATNLAVLSMILCHELAPLPRALTFPSLQTLCIHKCHDLGDGSGGRILQIATRKVSPQLRTLVLRDFRGQEGMPLLCRLQAIAAASSSSLPRTLQRLQYDCDTGELEGRIVEKILLDVAPLIPTLQKIAFDGDKIPSLREIAHRIKMERPHLNLTELIIPCRDVPLEMTDPVEQTAVLDILDSIPTLYHLEYWARTPPYFVLRNYLAVDVRKNSFLRTFFHRAALNHAGRKWVDVKYEGKNGKALSIPLSVWPLILARSSKWCMCCKAMGRDYCSRSSYFGDSCLTHKRSRLTGLYYLLRNGPLLVGQEVIGTKRPTIISTTTSTTTSNKNHLLGRSIPAVATVTQSQTTTTDIRSKRKRENEDDDDDGSNDDEDEEDDQGESNTGGSAPTDRRVRRRSPRRGPGPPVVLLIVMVLALSWSASAFHSPLAVSRHYEKTTERSVRSLQPWWCPRSFPPSRMAGATATDTAGDSDEPKGFRGRIGNAYSMLFPPTSSSPTGARRILLSRLAFFLALVFTGFRLGILYASQTATTTSTRSIFRQAPSRFPILAAALAIVFFRDVWQRVPGWAKPRLLQRAASGTQVLLGLKAYKEDDKTVVDETDIGDLDNLFGKVGTVMKVMQSRVDEASFNLRGSFFAYLNLLRQLKKSGSPVHDVWYAQNAVRNATVEDLEPLPLLVEMADWAYDEDPSGKSLKELLLEQNYTLMKHDKTILPGYLGHYVAIPTDPNDKRALIGVKGTSGLEDLMTDLCGASVEVELDRPWQVGSSTTTIRAHEGAAIATRRLTDDLRPLIQNLLLPQGYTLTLTGHSLGAAGVSLLSIFLLSDLPNLSPSQLQVYAFASPPTLDRATALAVAPFTTTVVNNVDVIPRCNVAPLAASVEVLRKVDEKIIERRDMQQQERAEWRKQHRWWWQRWAMRRSNLTDNLLKSPPPTLLMTDQELLEAIRNATSTVDVDDPDHLYVPGKVVLLYDLWNETEQVEIDPAPSNSTIIPEYAADRAIVCDGTSDVLRLVEWDGRMFDDHMPVGYRESLESVLQQMEKE